MKNYVKFGGVDSVTQVGGREASELLKRVIELRQDAFLPPVHRGTGHDVFLQLSPERFLHRQH